VVEGASIYTDRKFPDIVEAAARNEPITVEQNAGTQFIWAGDLARVYSAVASTDVDRRLYTSVSANFTTWEEIARMAIDHTNSTSELIVTESSIDPSEGRNDVSAIDDDFGLRFDSTPHLRDHVAYLAERAASPVAG
jgi:UDP-glucose 4-epimerase